MSTLYYWTLYIFGPLAVLDCVLRLASLRARRKHSAASKLGWARRRERENLSKLGEQAHREKWEAEKVGMWMQ